MFSTKELFFQLYGSMDVNIIQQNSYHTINIPEGNFFILPSRIPHSPQRLITFYLYSFDFYYIYNSSIKNRYANTVGIVFERERLPHEMDGLRWYEISY